MKISPLEFFLASVKHNRLGSLDWGLRSFTVTRNKPQLPTAVEQEPVEVTKNELSEFFKDSDIELDESVTLPGRDVSYLIWYEEGKAYCLDSDGNTVEVTTDKKNTPVLGINTHIELNKGDLANLDSKIKTTYGIAYLNAVCLTHYLGDVIPYMNGVLNPYEMASKIDKGVKDDLIEVPDAKKAKAAMYWVTGLMQIAVPSASRKTMIADKKIPKRRDELLKKNADKLHDPTEIARIEKELIDMDREYMKGDPAEIFYKKSKAYDVTRKRAHIMHGGEASLEGGNKMELIPTSLDDGIEIKYLPLMINSLRDGSLSRGLETALGGEIVKFLLRIFQKTKITEDDCGTKIGWALTSTYISDANLNGRYYIDAGKPKPFDDAAKAKFRGKKVVLRSPVGCATKGGNYCRRCIGDEVSHNENALSMLAVEVGSTFLDMFMAAMHGKALKLAEYDFKLHIH